MGWKVPRSGGGCRFTQNPLMSLNTKRDLSMIQKNRRVNKPGRRKLKPLTEGRVAEALRAAGGIGSHAARLLDRTPGRISQMIGESDYLKEVREEESEKLIALAKSSIREFLESGKLTYNRLIASMFTLKTLAKNEGWSERLETVGVHAHLNAGERGVLLLPQPAPDLNSWDDLASQWENERKRKEYDDDVDQEDY